MFNRYSRFRVWVGQHGIRHRIAERNRIKMMELIDLW